ncbi:hypothetical protein D7Y13_16960 [Corallococcus praedator]|uniref:Uncharacterized protein n=1 Tax=Corallococcus praedator TaxID=2316724 RepID=A0ABX9QI66_9BACT|nr:MULTISPECIES: hypothetical protein [Corallococcus]RKH13560.1 hypothetical protein D7X74_21600 [Corallococcus sp. CA047B]RKH28444.1 hypothetical protein D7X75_24740 [Corallococcus sp. CA031C]RKI07935.1 hypothetical protein D7Y13_16960 [Corallococcus praedator]
MSLIDSARRTVSNTIRQVKQDPIKAAKDIGTQAKKGYDTFTKVKTAVKDGFDNVKSLKTDGFKATLKGNVDKLVSKATDPKTKLDLKGKLGIAGKALGTLTSAAKLVGQTGTAISDVRNAVRSGSSEDWNKALGSVATAGKGAVSTVKGGLEIARDVQKFGSSYKAASSAFKAAVPNAGPKLARAAAGAAAKAAFEGGTSQAIKSGVRTAVSAAVKESGVAAKVITGTASRAAARAALTEGGKAAAKAGATAAAKAAGGTLAKAAGRFAPGANIAIAAFDTANAVSTVRDPNASTTKKVTSVITAVGSIAAATNIPVVSQVGAAVSAVSSFVGGLFG